MSNNQLATDNLQGAGQHLVSDMQYAVNQSTSMNFVQHDSTTNPADFQIDASISKMFFKKGQELQTPLRQSQDQSSSMIAPDDPLIQQFMNVMKENNLAPEQREVMMQMLHKMIQENNASCGEVGGTPSSVSSTQFIQHESNDYISSPQAFQEHAKPGENDMLSAREYKLPLAAIPETKDSIYEEHSRAMMSSTLSSNSQKDTVIIQKTSMISQSQPNLNLNLYESAISNPKSSVCTTNARPPLSPTSSQPISPRAPQPQRVLSPQNRLIHYIVDSDDMSNYKDQRIAVLKGDKQRALSRSPTSRASLGRRHNRIPSGSDYTAKNYNFSPPSLSKDHALGKVNAIENKENCYYQYQQQNNTQIAPVLQNCVSPPKACGYATNRPPTSQSFKNLQESENKSQKTSKSLTRSTTGRGNSAASCRMQMKGKKKVYDKHVFEIKDLKKQKSSSFLQKNMAANKSIQRKARHEESVQKQASSPSQSAQQKFIQQPLSSSTVALNASTTSNPYQAQNQFQEGRQEFDQQHQKMFFSPQANNSSANQATPLVYQMQTPLPGQIQHNQNYVTPGPPICQWNQVLPHEQPTFQNQPEQFVTPCQVPPEQYVIQQQNPQQYAQPVLNQYNPSYFGGSTRLQQAASSVQFYEQSAPPPPQQQSAQTQLQQQYQYNYPPDQTSNSAYQITEQSNFPFVQWRNSVGSAATSSAQYQQQQQNPQQQTTRYSTHQNEHEFYPKQINSTVYPDQQPALIPCHQGHTMSQKLTQTFKNQNNIAGFYSLMHNNDQAQIQSTKHFEKETQKKAKLAPMNKTTSINISSIGERTELQSVNDGETDAGLGLLISPKSLYNGPAVKQRGRNNLAAVSLSKRDTMRCFSPNEQLPSGSIGADGQCHKQGVKSPDKESTQPPKHAASTRCLPNMLFFNRENSDQQKQINSKKQQAQPQPINLIPRQRSLQEDTLSLKSRMTIGNNPADCTREDLLAHFQNFLSELDPPPARDTTLPSPINLFGRSSSQGSHRVTLNTQRESKIKRFSSLSNVGINSEGCLSCNLVAPPTSRNVQEKLEVMDTNKEEQIRVLNLEMEQMQKNFIQKSHRLNLADSQRQNLINRINIYKQSRKDPREGLGGGGKTSSSRNVDMPFQITKKQKDTLHEAEYECGPSFEEEEVKKP